MDVPAVNAKVAYFTKREIITLEKWLEAALVGDVVLADKIVTTGLEAEHFAADPALPEAEDFPLSAPPDMLAELRVKEAAADAALKEFADKRASGAYGQAVHRPVFPQDFNK